MSEDFRVIAVRMFVPQISDSQRLQQLQKLLRLLSDELRVRGLTIVEGMRGVDGGGSIHASTGGDVRQRDPDPPMIVEFFDEPGAAHEVLRMLRDLLPESNTVWWQASTDEVALVKAVPSAMEASTPSTNVTEHTARISESGRCGHGEASPGTEPPESLPADRQNDNTFEAPEWMDSTLSDLVQDEHTKLLAEGEDNAAAILQRIVRAPECMQIWEDIRDARGFYKGDRPTPQILDPVVRRELKKDEAIRSYVEKLEGVLSQLSDPLPLIRSYAFAHVAAEAAEIAALPIGSPSAETLAAGGALPTDVSITTIREAKRRIRSRVEARFGPQRAPVLHCLTERVREECLVFFVRGILLRDVGALHHPTIAALASAALARPVNAWKLGTILDRLRKRERRAGIRSIP